MQKIWIVKLPDKDAHFLKEQLLKKLAKPFKVRAKRYLNLESSLCFMTGRLLLKKVLNKNNISSKLLDELQYSEEGKPSFLNYNFSISHSNWYVSLIFGTTFSVGIDIEKKRSIDIKLFKYLFTALEWKSIMDAENPIDHFYWFWVRKEALLKAVGCSLKDLKQLEINEHYGSYKGKHYYFKPFYFDTKFNGIIATEEQLEIKVEFVDINELLEK
ncbi:4'-phosphopantetheinyl transferase family protein [Patiriisocius marinus]|uniref:4'-phosphopantetheinyl transferase n=1 Tax=Patiriisocius marinus TaxID=1397112 RepID=A0A5J4IN71_9FLAO|nr:4'-phosphopantetheinyl transferase superfamily protein [Patiriisocius marinus]GER58789.1 4'-phosphopantetheinyl transferase [Patiriisocius marinus]